jgi:hypothetical protein
MSDADAYMALALNNAQGELHPLEEGMACDRERVVDRGGELSLPVGHDGRAKPQDGRAARRHLQGHATEGEGEGAAIADHVDADERRCVTISYPPSGDNKTTPVEQTVTFLSESGVWALVMRSNKPEAKR